MKLKIPNYSYVANSKACFEEGIVKKSKNENASVLSVMEELLHASIARNGSNRIEIKNKTN